MLPPASRTATKAIDAALAGLQAGLVAVVFFLAWVGVAGLAEHRNFWAAENALAGVFYGPSVIRGGSWAVAASGLALYLLIYSLLGALFAAVIRTKIPRWRLTLIATLFGVAWHHAAVLLATAFIGSMAGLQIGGGMNMLGHAVYGALLARYRLYLAEPDLPVENAAAEPADEALPAAGAMAAGTAAGDAPPATQ